MEEPNPYEPPQPPEPLTTKQVVKRGLSLITIAWLTPWAVLISAWFSCQAGVTFAERHGDGWAINAGIAIFLTPPLVILISMIVLAVWTASKAKVTNPHSEQRGPLDSNDDRRLM